MKTKFLFLVALLTFGVIACDRTARETGAKAAPIGGSPEYTVVAHTNTVPGVGGASDVLPKKKGALDGEALFVKNCSACHQVTGKGVPGAFPPLDGSPSVNSDNKERMATIMIYGLMGEIPVMGTMYNSVMAPLGALPDEELAAIATYVRGAWSNKAGPVEAAVFTEVRSKQGSRGPCNINELGAEK